MRERRGKQQCQADLARNGTANSRTIRNCTMNNSVFCHFRGFPFCLYNSEPFHPSPFSLRRNPSWTGNLQRLLAWLTCRWHFRGACGKPPAGSMLTARMWDFCDIHILAMLTELQYIRRDFLDFFFFFLILYIVWGIGWNMKLKVNCTILVP